MTDILTDRTTASASGPADGPGTGDAAAFPTANGRATARTGGRATSAGAGRATSARTTGEEGRDRATGRRRLDAARRLRTLTGVDEELLARVRYERSKYTALGGVVLGTSVIAGFSMWNFATEALGRVSVAALVPTVIWMLFVLNLDRWLVTPQPNARRRVGPLLTRLLIALLLGAVIAEPLVLRIFQTAVEQHVADERTRVVDELRTNLVRCNPVPSTTRTAVPKGCGTTYILSFGATPGEQAEELAALRSDATTLQKRVDVDTTRLEAIDSEVRDECRVLIRMASTGLYQRTSECRRLRDKARDYRTTHHTGENEKRLAGMHSRISGIEAGLTSSRTAFLKTRADGIERRLDAERAKQKEIGALERIRALDELASGNAVLFVGIWLVRLLFVLLDVLPVLVKYLSGETAYDRMLTGESNSAVKIHSEEVRLAERRAMANLEIGQDAIEQEVRRHRVESEAALREHTATMNIRVRQAVNALQDEIRRSSTV
ncbi:MULTISPECIES: DUF4407 domain-containing protein [unclassified Streptomyces]|uniref:DUF4407 domain-containing protein n=1 Tax=unclassified Streptomyces TaxID=2593676 RepID=UPI00070F7571|nr:MULTISPECIES: DUF4407 domain-containing protein [unclassified Streptomyces]KRD18891.1 hypothetical protein ASE41_19105 [Streptomyces sp. Root264]